MNDKKILTIQDISCFGQCSLTVALPILSCAGHETIILPSAVLSTHTSGFKGFTFRDLTDDIPLINNHWQQENIKFDALYTGYLGSIKQIDYIMDIAKTSLTKDAAFIVDPAMADNGKLYPLFNQDYVEAMKQLCFAADIIVPNITEAALLADMEYKTVYDKEYIKSLLDKLVSLGAKTIVLTGVKYDDESTGVVVYEKNTYQYYRHRLIAQGCHGTGDIYASSFVGALVAGKELFEAAKIAADFTVSCIENTQQDENHWYGAKFEKQLPLLIKAINN